MDEENNDSERIDSVKEEEEANNNDEDRIDTVGEARKDNERIETVEAANIIVTEKTVTEKARRENHQYRENLYCEYYRIETSVPRKPTLKAVTANTTAETARIVKKIDITTAVTF